MKRKKNTKKVVLISISVLLAAAIGLGCFFYFGKGSSQPVIVVPFMHVGTDSYWFGSKYTQGPVTTDRIQTIYLSNTQTVTEVLVQPGDTVKKGDVLMRFDTTLSDLALERKRLEVEKLKLDLDDAYERLEEIRNMVPMVIPTPEPEPDPSDPTEAPDLGQALQSPYQIIGPSTYNGASPAFPVICWLGNDTSEIDNSLLEALRQYAAKLQGLSPEPAHQWESEYRIDKLPTCREGGSESIHCRICGATKDSRSIPKLEHTWIVQESRQENDKLYITYTCMVCKEEKTDTYALEMPTEPSTEPTTEPATVPSESSGTGSTESTVPPTPEESTDSSAAGNLLVSQDGGGLKLVMLSNTDTQPTEPLPSPGIFDFYVVLKITEGDMSKGATTMWQGVYVSYLGENDFAFRLFDASSIKDPTLEEEDSQPEFPEIDFGSGYTAAQIAQMRREQEKTIKDLSFQIEMTEADYKIMQKELESGEVVADFDGSVVSLLDQEEAKLTGQPFLKVSGGGGFYIQGTIGELDMPNISIGQEVTINDWYTGNTITGTIQSIGNYPAENMGGWSSMYNPNVTYYPFTVFVDGSADLMEGNYVEIQYDSQSDMQTGVFLEMPFVRTEGDTSYVYVLGANGKLEQRTVTLGRAIDNYYYEILDGLSETDLIAFPYGKNVYAGASTQEGTRQDLYNY